MNKYQTVVASLLIVGLAGCQQNNPSGQGQNTDNNSHTKYQEVKQSTNENKGKNVNSEGISQHLVKVANREPKVNDATALVTMGYAVVGLDVDKDLDRQHVDEVKYSVAEAMKHERYGANAVIIADPDSVQQLKEMKNEIQNGRPVTGVLDQLADMVGRLMPQIPSNMTKQPTKNTKPENNNQVPNMKNQKMNHNNQPNKQNTPQKQKPNQMNKKTPNNTNQR